MSTTESVLARVATGDKAAFSELYDALAPRVLGQARKLIINRAMAEEITQEVFLDIWQSASRFDAARGSAIGWVLAITRTKAIDRIRSEESARVRDETIGRRDFKREFDEVVEAVDASFVRETVRSALAGLTTLQREAITLFYDGYSHSEIARQLGVPLGTVKSRLHDGMARLRRDLVPA